MLRFGFTKCLMTVLTVLLCLTSNALAAQTGQSEAIIAQEIAALTASVNNLVQQMEEQAGSLKRDTSLRKLDIAIAYLNLRSRRIDMFERDLQATRNNCNRLEDVLEQLRREEDSLPQAFESNQQEALQKAREELNFRRETVKDRISRLEEESVLLENRIMEMQSQIDSVESYVQKNLDF